MNTAFGLRGTGTAAAALAIGLLSAIPPTLNITGGSSLVRTPVRNATAAPINERRSFAGVSIDSTLSPDLVPLTGQQIGEVSVRETSQLEKTVGELRRWLGLAANWDGEEAAAPIAHSLESACDFVRLLPEAIADAEPMLHASGHAGLFWNERNLYADLEFLGGGRIAYFIKHHEDKHKGVLRFDGESVPPVLSALLETPTVS